MTDGHADHVDGASKALVDALREQMMDRTRSQEQLLAVTAAVGGAAAAFGGKWLHSNPEVLAFLALLFITLALAMLRQDQEISTIASFLVTRGAVHADPQRLWEHHKYEAMFAGRTIYRWATLAQVVGIYGVPLGAYLATVVAAVHLRASGFAWGLLWPSFVLALLFGTGAIAVFNRYRSLGGELDRGDSRAVA